VFLVNRSLTETVTVSIDAGTLGVDTLRSADTLHDDDFSATNTLNNQDRVVPEPNKSARIDNGTVTVTLPPVSWTALDLH